MVKDAVRLTLAATLFLTGCATVGPNLSARGLREARNVEARADSVRLADSVSGPQPGTRTSRAGATSPAPLTLTWTNPSHLPAYESPGYRCACRPGSGVADTLLDLHHVEVWEVPRRERADGSVCDPPDTSCWFRNPPRVVASVLAVGRQGMRESVTVVPAWRAATYFVRAVDDNGNVSCASNLVTVER